jgi:hypothetical protein
MNKFVSVTFTYFDGFWVKFENSSYPHLIKLSKCVSLKSVNGMTNFSYGPK